MLSFSIIGAIIFGCIALLTLLVTLGYPLGEFTLGGKYKILPSKMRIMSGISLIIQAVAIIAILDAGEVITTVFLLMYKRDYAFSLDFIFY